jgi:hypothetical protein
MVRQLASWDAPISWNAQFLVSLECRNLKQNTIPIENMQNSHVIMEPYSFKCREYNENLTVHKMTIDD